MINIYPSDKLTTVTMTLALYRDDALAEVRTWGSMPLEARRRACLRALRDRDVSALQDLLIGYMKLKGSKGTRLAGGTERSYRCAMKVLVQVSEQQGLSLVQPSDEFAALFMRALEAKGQRSSTIRVRVVAVKTLYRAARWCGLDIPCPWEDAKTPYYPDAAVRMPYPESDVRKLLEFPDVRVRAVLLLGAHAGLRAFEMCALTARDVDLVQEQLTVRHGKGDKARVIPMTDELTAAMRALTLARPTGTLLWASYHKLRDRMVEVCEFMRVEYRGLHALRHTAGTELYRATGDLYVTAALLGHKDIKTTQIYAHMSQKHLRDALRKRAG